MKPLPLLFSLLVYSVSFCQEKPTEKSSPSLFLGITGTHVISLAEYTRRYALISPSNYYYTQIEDQTNSRYCQIESGFEWDKAYVSGAFGVGIENTTLRASHSYQWADVSVGGSSKVDERVKVNIREKYTYFIGSLEGGLFFSKPDKRFRLSLGVGTDINVHSITQFDRSEVEDYQHSSVTTNFPGNPVTNSFTSSTRVKKEDPEWSDYIRNNKMPIFLPKLTLSAFYHTSENFTFSLKAQMRVLFIEPGVYATSNFPEIPLQVGMHYHF